MRVGSEPLRIAVCRSPRAMTALDPVAELRRCVDDVPKPFPMKLSTGRVIETLQEWKGLQWEKGVLGTPQGFTKQESAELARLVWDGYKAADAACVPLINAVTVELESIAEELLEALSNAVKESGGAGLARRLLPVMEALTQQSRIVEQLEGPLRQRRGKALSASPTAIGNLISCGFNLGPKHPTESELQEARVSLDQAVVWADLHIGLCRNTFFLSVYTVKSTPRLIPVKKGARRELAQMVCDGCNAAEAACVRLMNVVTAELESIREELLEALSNELKEAGGPQDGKKLNVWAGIFVRVTETLSSQSRFVEEAERSPTNPRDRREHLPRGVSCTTSLIETLISLRGQVESEGLLRREHPTASELREIQTQLNVAGEWADLSRHVESCAMPPCSGVNTFESPHRPIPLKEGARRELAQLVWAGTCTAWGQLEAAGVAVMNEVTAELEAMREELLERLWEALHGGGAGSDYASSLRTGMLAKVTDSLSEQAKLIKQAERQRGPQRQASEHPYYATCVSAIDNLIELQQCLPMEFYILQSSRPKHPTARDLQEMKKHLKEPLSATSAWGRLWEDKSWQRILDHSGLHFDDAAKNDDLCLTPVKNGVQVSQAIKGRREEIREETAAKLQVERDAAQKEIRELKARCDDLEERYEALKSSLNAEASQAFAHLAWQGNREISSASPASLSSWNVVASGSGGSQTILSTSWISVATIGPCCFLKDAIFKIKTESGYDFREAKDLQMGSQVVAENGEIIEVKTSPELHVVHELVELQTESACLQISPDHRIVRHDKSAVPRLHSLLRCGLLSSLNLSHKH